MKYLHLQTVSLVVLLLSLSSCGFTLRGSESGSLPIDRLTLTFANSLHPMQEPLSRYLASYDVELVPRNASDFELLLSAESIEQQTVSLNTRAGAGQYELRLSVEAALHLNGALMAGPERFQVQGNFFEDTANIGGSQSGREIALDDLRQELAQQIVLRLQAIET